MSFYFTYVAPKFNSTLAYLASPAFKSHLFNAFVLLVCLIAFYVSLVIDIFCFCFALACNCFYHVLDCQPVPAIEEREVDTTVYLPLPKPIVGLLMPSAEDRVLVTPVTHEDRVLVTPTKELSADVLSIHTVVADKSVAFNLNGTHEYRAIVCKDDDGLTCLRWQYKYSKKYMPVRNATVAFGDAYDYIVRACYVALGMA